MPPKHKNEYSSSEDWLRAATEMLRAFLAALDIYIPEKIRFSIAFTSRGKATGASQAKTGVWPAECWPAAATDDGFCEIIIRADFDDRIEILGLLIHELIHAALGDGKHGEAFREAALRVGLEGPMRKAMPGKVLRERLHALADELGRLPRSRLNFDRVTLAGLPVADRPKKQSTRMLKAECREPGCGYTVRVAAKWIAEYGAPHCPKHGAMHTPLAKEPAAASDEAAE